MVMMFLIIISLMGIGLLSMAGMELELYKRTEASRQAFFLAEAGAQRTQALLAVEGDWETSPGANVVFSEESFQDGTYTVHLENVSAGEATIVAEGTYPRTGTLRTTRRVRLVVER
jgi:Tfp pilus assembly protein PilV